MKKKFFIYLTMIMLSFSVMVGGIYAAKTATFGISSVVMIYPLACKARISAVTAEGYASWTKASSSGGLLSVIVQGDQNSSTLAKDSLDIGSFTFDDITSSGDTVKDIVITLFANNDNTYTIGVLCTAQSSNNNNFTVSVDKTTEQSIATGTSQIFKITLRCVNKTTSWDATGLTVNLHFRKLVV